MKSIAPILVAGLLLPAAASCSPGREAQPVSPATSGEVEAVTVSAESLFDPEAARDPVITYRLRLATEPSNPALHNNLGNLYVLRGWMDEAVKSYKRALKLNPDLAIAWNNLGTAYLKQGDLGQAMSAFRTAVEKDPRYALAWYNMAVIHDANGEYEKMLDTYLKAISLQPSLLSAEVNPQVVNNRHLMAIRVRRYLEEEGNAALPLEAMPE